MISDKNICILDKYLIHVHVQHKQNDKAFILVSNNLFNTLIHRNKLKYFN